MNSVGLNVLIFMGELDVARRELHSTICSLLAVEMNVQCGAAAAALHSPGSNDSPLASQLLQELPELHLHFLAGRKRGKGVLVPGENEGGERRWGEDGAKQEYYNKMAPRSSSH